MKTEEVIRHLQQNYQSDDELAYMLYCRTDVAIYLTTEKKRFLGVVLTDAEKDEVLVIMHKHQDCENGMTWTSMSVAIEQVLEERSTK